MSTRKQRAASRANAQKSTGPRTPDGKANSRFNALKHGIDAKQQVMFTESAEDLAELAAEYHELYSPANVDERFLVDTLINNEWRLRRLRCVEADLWSSVGTFATGVSTFERLQRIINSCQRHYDRARKELQSAQAARDNHLQAPQPEDAKTTSESPASFRNNPETVATTPSKPAPQAPADLVPGHLDALTPPLARVAPGS